MSIGGHLCRRTAYEVILSATPGSPNAPETMLAIGDPDHRDQLGTIYPEPASPAACAALRTYVTPVPMNFEETREALDRLVGAMAAARGRAALPFALACKGPSARGEACADERTALAALPLDAMFGVAFDTWPRADGKRRVATVEFGRSGRDGQSWRITLLGQDRLDEVRMQRHQIMYH